MLTVITAWLVRKEDVHIYIHIDIYIFQKQIHMWS